MPLSLASVFSYAGFGGRGKPSGSMTPALAPVITRAGVRSEPGVESSLFVCLFLPGNLQCEFSVQSMIHVSTFGTNVCVYFRNKVPSLTCF